MLWTDALCGAAGIVVFVIGGGRARVVARRRRPSELSPDGLTAMAAKGTAGERSPSLALWAIRYQGWRCFRPNFCKLDALPSRTAPRSLTRGAGRCTTPRRSGIESLAPHSGACLFKVAVLRTDRVRIGVIALFGTSSAILALVDTLRPDARCRFGTASEHPLGHAGNVDAGRATDCRSSRSRTRVQAPARDARRGKALLRTG